ncbi:transcriptional regulator SplA domain-containing protein [Bacillus pakistanensis]|nr:transcriptional regulator SplA domain-containing protein [Bacillus pakistanensis]
MEVNHDPNDYSTHQVGDTVYVFYRNPHTQDVANIREAAVVLSPEDPNELALFLFETYYPLTNEVAVYKSEAEAENAYQQYFGSH